MSPSVDRDRWNGCRHEENGEGHYESYFLRANHPSEARAFWIRYTIFDPRTGTPGEALGELWAIYFGPSGITAVRQTWPLASCHFSRDGLDVQVGGATLNDDRLEGEASLGDHTIGWSLDVDGGGSPLLLLPEPLYEGGFPRAKALVPRPLARFSGRLMVDGEQVEISDWVGSQNHNWGSKHTDHYAWGQVAGFDEAPDAFLEVSTARLKIGPLWTPFFAPIVLRIDGQTHAFNALARSVWSHGAFRYFHWTFDNRGRDLRIRGRIQASGRDFTALEYLNPPGGSKVCLNSKVASCDLSVQRRGERARVLRSANRAAFEILTDDLTGHGIEISA